MTTRLERELIDLEREYWDAMISKDADVTTRLVGEQGIYAGPTGVSLIGADTIGEMVRSDDWTLKRYDFDDVKVLTPARNMAIVAYHVTEQVEVGGRDITLEANDATVWQRQDGRWVSVLHTESLTGDPFGRDRANGHQE
jgi:hypothetical protein